MTVHVDLDAEFTAIYAAHARRLHRYIWWCLGVEHHALAEDLASETFIELWRRMTTGRDGDLDIARVSGLLKFMARQRIGDFFSKRKNNEWAIDCADSANTPLIVTGHGYAIERPDVAPLVADFHTAMDQMSAASQTWRDAHKETYRLRGMLRDDFRSTRGGLSPEAKQTLTEQLANADAREETSLHAFRDTCSQVGRLRAEIEAVAGSNWRSSTGLPVNPEITAKKKGSFRNDRSVTHCPDGHLLDLDNTHFEPDGSRLCRACKSAYTAARQQPKKNPARQTVDEQVLAKAREMLSDPANAHRPLTAIATDLGISDSTLRTRIPDAAALRRQSGNGAQYAAAKEKVLCLLMDPGCTLTRKQIAQAAGLSVMSVYKLLREVRAQQVTTPVRADR